MKVIFDDNVSEIISADKLKDDEYDLVFGNPIKATTVTDDSTGVFRIFWIKEREVSYTSWDSLKELAEYMAYEHEFENEIYAYPRGEIVVSINYITPKK